MKGFPLATLLLAGTMLGGAHAATTARPRHVAMSGAPAGGASAAQAKPQDPAPVASGAAHAASADNIVLVDGDATIRIRHIEIAGSALTDGDVAALFKTKSAADLEMRLRTLDAATILIPEIVVDRTGPTDTMHLRQVQVLLADIRGGRAATGSAANATVTLKTDKADVEVAIGATTFKGLDLAQIVHLATGPRTDDQPVRGLCDEVAMNAISLTGAAEGAKPLTIASLRGTGLKGRPPAAPPAAGSTGSDASRANLFRSIAIDTLDAEALAVAPAAQMPASGLKSFSLKHVALSGLGDGKLARFALDGLAVDSKPGTLSLATAEISNVAFSTAAIPSIDRIDLRDAALDVPASDTKPEERIALSVAHAAYEAPGLVIGKLPARSALQVEHFAFDVPAKTAAAPLLTAMGYKRVDLSSVTDSHYDAPAKALFIDRFSLSGVDMGVLDLRLALANVAEAIVSQDDEAQKAAAAAVRVRSLDLKLTNAGLIDKAIAFKAAIDGVDLAQERTNIDQLIDTGLVGIGLQGSAKAQAIVAALHAFVAAPKTLHLGISSKAGLGSDSIGLMGDPQALLDTLDVEADAGR